MKKGETEEVGEALFLWFVQKREKGLPISGPILQEKTLQFYKDLGNEGGELTTSEGWLEKWKLWYGVRKLQISGEKLSADESSVKGFKLVCHALVEREGLTGEQLYTCDETGLNYKMLPGNTLASKEEDCAPGHKKERVTILACSNATGTQKLKLTMIGKSKNP